MTGQPDLDARRAAADEAAADLARAITRARRLPAARRAAEARRLGDQARHVFADLADVAVAEAVTTASWDEVAAVLGTSTASVAKALRRYRGQGWSRGSRGRDVAPAAEESPLLHHRDVTPGS